MTYDDDDTLCAICNKPGVETQPDYDGDRYHYACIEALFAEVGEEPPAWAQKR